MDVEFHQLDRRLEYLRVRSPQRQRRLVASLAEAGQQTPIVVVAAGGVPDRYLVIDGFKRIAALERLGRDTVRAVVWPMEEAEALLLERSLRLGEQETALEQGWLLAELREHFGWGLEELARRFDRDMSWVSRRLSLVEVLPQAVQQWVREGKIAPHIAMKVLVPVARAKVEHCQRMAEVFARGRWSTRDAGQLYTAWRSSGSSVRERILESPELYLRTQREIEQPLPPAAPVADLMRDLEMVTAIAVRAQRKLAATVATMSQEQIAEARGRVESAHHQLGALAGRIEEEQQRHAQQRTTNHDSGAQRAGSEHGADRTPSGSDASDGTPGAAGGLGGGAGAGSAGESHPAPPADPRSVRGVQGESGASP
jgi:ParB family transcriptional regulator, chromosome partitioning protein